MIKEYQRITTVILRRKPKHVLNDVVAFQPERYVKPKRILNLWQNLIFH